MSLEPLLDVHQVAAIMRIHIKKVQRLARTGVLPCAKIGSVYRFEESALRGWIKNEVSKRVPQKEKTKVGRVGLGVQVSGLGGSDETEDSQLLRIPNYRIREGRIAVAGILPE